VIPTAREIAARVVERVHKDRAFAAAALAAELERYPELDPRERGLATELSYGTLRSKTALSNRLARLTPRGLDDLDALVLAHLLVAAYQVLVLERVPSHAAVDAAVGAVKRSRNARLAGFVNAVLRKLSASGDKLDRAQAIIEGAPAWLVERLEASVGRDEALALFGAGPTDASPAQTTLRLRSADPELLPEWIGEAVRGRVSPLARLLRASGDPRRLPGFAEGRFVVQEEGSQLVALAVGARAGERVLDACAGRGQKTTLLAERVGPGGQLWASDSHPAKLRALEREIARLGLPPPQLVSVDWTVGVGSVPDDFDRVLVDAPCTGTGTLGRRPEIAFRLTPEDPARLSATAEAILRRAATRAGAGGRVLFSVCSVLREECEDLVARVADVLEPAPFDAPELASVIEPGSTSFRLLPLQHGTDGYFVASFVRRSEQERT
jgi:16S rRNA (cytosine967-C5)-methyltransferase